MSNIGSWRLGSIARAHRAGAAKTASRVLRRLRRASCASHSNSALDCLVTFSLYMRIFILFSLRAAAR